MNSTDKVVQFTCGAAALVGILSLPNKTPTRGVLIVVGGPQYRAGSHRQFTLLARYLADNGIAAMRFDYRGMGDSEGEARSFEAIDEDLRAAVNTFFVEVPTLESVVLWGLCDGACAALFYAPNDARISGLVLLNPWMHTEAGAARTLLKHYYIARLMDREFWGKLIHGRFDAFAALRSLVQILVRVKTTAQAKPDTAGGVIDAQTLPTDIATLPDRMQQCFRNFEGKILLVISGRDLTARQFLDTVAGSREWRKLIRLPRVSCHTLADADHTFSRRVWRDQVASWTARWINSW